jgi:gliding motility-associated-like protein
MKMNKLQTKIGKLLLTIVAIFALGMEANSQCTPTYSGAICANSPILFQTNSPGATNIEWDFNGVKVLGQNPATYAFSAPGTYSVTIKLTTASGQPCTQTISITILEPPVLDVDIITPRVQCFQGNKFTVIDRSKPAPGSRIKRVKYVVAGLLVEETYPTMPYTFDFTTADPQGGFYSMDIEIEDENGCVTKQTLIDAVEVKPSLFLGFTSNRPIGCDSVLMKIVNRSLIDRNDVLRFRWDFGDGTSDTVNWGTLPDTVKHWFYLQGPNNGQFTTTLTVTDKSGCTEVFSFNASATNLLVGGYIASDYDSLCFAGNRIEFEVKPGIPTGATGFVWVFGDPDSGPQNVSQNNPATHAFTKPGPFLVAFNYFHPICGNKSIYKQIQIIGPQSSIPGPQIPLNQRYQCKFQDTVFFPNASVFFHNDRDFSDDAGGYFNVDSNYWIYYFDSAGQTLRNENLDKRGNDCIFRLWNFDDDYAPRCTTDSRPIYPQLARYNNLHLTADPNTGLWPRNTTDVNGKWINCNFSFDSLPKHGYTDWDVIYQDSFYAQNRTFSKTIIDTFFTPDRFGLDSTAYRCVILTIDTMDAEEHRRLFYLEIPRCYTVRLFHEDKCHPLECSDMANTSLAILPPNASGLKKEGRYCFGGPPNYGVTLDLGAGTKPGCTASEVYINPDTALNPNNWIAQYPGGATGTLPSPGPILPYAMSGPYPSQIFINYPNPGSVRDTVRGYANIGLIIGNGTGTNKCYDTVYYDKFIKFPVIDSKIDILIPRAPLAGFTNVYKICIGDSLVMRVPRNNLTNPYDVDQITYRLQRIAPTLNEDPRFPFYSYTIFENYQWFQPVAGQSYLENRLIRQVARVKGTAPSQTIKQDTIVTGRVYKYTSEADITEIYDIMEQLFESIGFKLSAMNNAEIAQVIQAGCVDTTGLGNFIRFDIFADSSEHLHYRDTSIYALDKFYDQDLADLVDQNGDTVDYNDSVDYRSNAYTIVAEENGIFNWTFNIRSRIGGCVTQAGQRVIVGFYNRLSVSDSIICQETEIDAIPYFRYFHIDPDNNTIQPPWLDLTDYWTNRETDAGKPSIEFFTRWDWASQDDDTADINTIFGGPNHEEPYGFTGYSNVVGGGLVNKKYYYENGFYTMRVAAQDSLGCTDTLKQNIYVTKLIANFGFNDTLNQCINIITLLDSTLLLDPCTKELNKNCDEIIEWFIDWGDGKRPDVFNKFTYPPNLGFNIGHNYTRNGTFQIKLRAKTKLGCEDSITKTIVLGGPIPYFESNKLEICAGDSIEFYNLSERQTQSSQWIWNFGDGKAKSEQFANKEDTFSWRYDNPGVYQVFLSMFDSMGGRYCGFTYPDTTGGSQMAYEITVKPRNIIKIFADKDSICPGETIRFESRGDKDYIGYVWNFNAELNPPDPTQISTTTDTFITKTFFERGVFMVTLDGVPDPNLDMCPYSDTIMIYVDSIKADFEIDSTKAPEFCFINTSTNATKSTWGYYHLTDIVTNSGEEFKENKESMDQRVCNNFFDSLGQYYVCLVVENTSGCKDTLCKPVYNFNLIQVPNVFTPGSDGKNDKFNIPIMGHEFYDLSIRNRWGDVVFKSDDSEVDWNGKVNNTGADCPDGTYFYIFNYRFKGTGETKEVSGVITLIREK